jgi:hypothetical protein
MRPTLPNGGESPPQGDVKEKITRGQASRPRASHGAPCREPGMLGAGHRPSAVTTRRLWQGGPPPVSTTMAIEGRLHAAALGATS